MKKLIITLCLCLVFHFNYSQEIYAINGETLELKTELNGSLDLLWNIIDGNYRYFIKKSDGSITELENTKGSDNKYQEEYKTVLQEATGGLSTDKVKLTLYSLRNFIDAYNTSKDSNYTSFSTTESGVQFRLGFSAGITNNPFVGNTDNNKNLLIGAELEIYETTNLPRHSGFFQLRQAFQSDDFPYSTTELSLGYRYRIINKAKFSIYGQLKMATLNFSSVTFESESNTEIDQSDTSFDIPLIFGIGSDIKIGDHSFLTIIYGELFAVLLDNQGNFSTDIAIGYKFNL